MSKQSRMKKKKEGYVPRAAQEQHFSKPKGSGEIKNGIFVYEGDITVDQLAKKLGLNPSEIVKSFFLKGKLLNINSVLDDELIAEICIEHGIDFQRKEIVDPSDFSKENIQDDPSTLVERPPVIVVMGHVDHGKTTLIDRIRHSRVAEGEAGGITQEIGAYQKEVKGKKITILDTPGHEAFTAMRARGAKIGDVAILVVAADDGVMPQTKEAVDHARAANLPIVVAVNKCDKPGANADKVMSELAGINLTPEEWGGDTVCCKISAKSGKGIDELLDNVLTVAELLELKANPNRLAEGSVIDAQMDKREGAKATLLVRNGTLHIGDFLVVGNAYCKVRRMINEYGKPVKEAGPSTPVAVLGFSEVPTAGDIFRAFSTDKEARDIASQRQQKALSKNRSQGFSLDTAFAQMNKDEGESTINLIVKSDTQGTSEALKDALSKLSVPSVNLKLIRCASGEVSEGDVVLAEASHASIITFNVHASTLASALAKEKNIEIRHYDVIYHLTEDITKAMKGLLKPIFVEKVYGHGEVRAIFKSSKAGLIAGVYVTDGVLKSNSQVRIFRKEELIETSKLTSLKHVKDDIKEAKTKTECGLTIASNFKIEEEDTIECFGMEEERQDG